MEEFDKGFSFIFGLSDGDDDTEGKESGEEERVEKGTEEVSEPNKTYGIMCLIHDYSDFTNTKWSEVWDINIIEFFQTIAFIKEYKRREAQQIKDYQRKIKNGIK